MDNFLITVLTYSAVFVCVPATDKCLSEHRVVQGTASWERGKFCDFVPKPTDCLVEPDGVEVISYHWCSYVCVWKTHFKNPCSQCKTFLLLCDR